MLGFVLAVLLVLVLGGTMLFMWLAVVIDDLWLARSDVAYRRQWLNDWESYSRHHPEVPKSVYIREHAEDHPVNMLYVRQRSYEKLLYGVAGCCMFLEIVLLWYGFETYDRTDHRTAFSLLCAFTVLVAICLLVWWYLIVEEIVLPGYARTEPHYRSPVPPLD